VTVRRTAVVDEYTEDGETVVLLEDGSVLALSPLASFVLALVSERPMEPTQLAARLREVFGAPSGDPSAIETTYAVLATLHGHGLIRS
jgi:hypothetical protein